MERYSGVKVREIERPKFESKFSACSAFVELQIFLLYDIDMNTCFIHAYVYCNPYKFTCIDLSIHPFTEQKFIKCS